MREISRQELLGQLRESVALLAAPASEQERWLAEHRVPVDELALQLDDEVPGWFSPLTEAGLLSPATQTALRALNDFFLSFSGPQNAALWTEEALYEAQEWQHARELAQQALADMDRDTEEE
jgi:hypothetical protein